MSDVVAENEQICEKLLGWSRCEGSLTDPCNGWMADGCYHIEQTPTFKDWAEAGLILEALQKRPGWQAAHACSAFGWLLKTRELTPLAIRAAALEYIKAVKP